MRRGHKKRRIAAISGNPFTGGGPHIAAESRGGRRDGIGLPDCGAPYPVSSDMPRKPHVMGIFRTHSEPTVHGDHCEYLNFNVLSEWQYRRISARGRKLPVGTRRLRSVGWGKRSAIAVPVLIAHARKRQPHHGDRRAERQGRLVVAHCCRRLSA